jgi:hypothetical protein
MEPSPEQILQLALGFEVYSRKRSAVIAGEAFSTAVSHGAVTAL